MADQPAAKAAPAAKPAAAKAAPAPQEPTERERQLEERLARMEAANKRERRSIDPGSEDFDVATAVQALNPGSPLGD